VLFSLPILAALSAPIAAPVPESIEELPTAIWQIAPIARGERLKPWEIPATAAFYLVYPSAVIAALGFGRALAFMALQQALYGVSLASITAPNHWAMPMPADTHTMDYVRHQVVTSRNLAGGALVDLWYGGLNLQIEHHLFPTMARNKLREAREVVRAFCAERGIPYHEVSPLAAYRDIYVTMRRVARHVRRGEG
jgi:fatty acid desaturase